MGAQGNCDCPDDWRRAGIFTGTRLLDVSAGPGVIFLKLTGLLAIAQTIREMAQGAAPAKNKQQIH